MLNQDQLYWWQQMQETIVTAMKLCWRSSRCSTLRLMTLVVSLFTNMFRPSVTSNFLVSMQKSALMPRTGLHTFDEALTSLIQSSMTRH